MTQQLLTEQVRVHALIIIHVDEQRTALKAQATGRVPRSGPYLSVYVGEVFRAEGFFQRLVQRAHENRRVGSETSIQALSQVLESY